LLWLLRYVAVTIPNLSWVFWQILGEAGILETHSIAEIKIMLVCTNLVTFISAAVSLGLCR
jgi:hypothetical protein